jgi:DNA-binding transcriptional ArsR family regulator
VVESGDIGALSIAAESVGGSPVSVTVASEVFRSRILAGLGDPENIAIIRSITKESKTAVKISSETHIPASTVYRKLVELKELGLVIRDHVEIKGGKRLTFHVAAFSEIRLKSAGGVLRLEMVPSAAAASRAWLNLLWSNSLPEGT